jgi:Zn-dependent protease with chaperone function
LTLGVFTAAQWLAQREEFEADRFAVDQGFGMGMLQFLQRFPGKGGTFHPPTNERAARVSQSIKEKGHVRTTD